ncbi:MAG: alcohol dehydrogenase catalytic domain-containing protein [Candidatus Coatesbacteria bacterium]
MKAAMLTGPRRIAVLEVPVPRPKRGEALVRVRAVGICRSDLHYYLHGRIGSQVVESYPQALGHEPAGEVAALGPGVRGLRVGDRVAVEPAVPCGKCAMCRAGRGNICAKVRFLGMPGLPGAFCEYLAWPAASLARIPASVSFAEAAALEPFAIGVHAVSLFGSRRIRTAAVVGCGPVGVSVVAALTFRRAAVTACDYVPARLRVARRMGAGRTIRIDPRRPMGLQAAALGAPEVVVEAGGTTESLDLAIRVIRAGGTIAVIGIMDEDLTPVDLHVARRKELVILNVRRSNGELPACIRLLASRRVDLRPMVTHQGGLSDAARLFRLAAGRSGGVVKALILP